MNEAILIMTRQIGLLTGLILYLSTLQLFAQNNALEDFFAEPDAHIMHIVDERYDAKPGFRPFKWAFRTFFYQQYDYELQRLCIAQDFFVMISFNSKRQIEQILYSENIDTLLAEMVKTTLLLHEKDWIVPDRAIGIPLVAFMRFNFKNCPFDDVEKMIYKANKEKDLLSFGSFINMDNQQKKNLVGSLFHYLGECEIIYDEQNYQYRLKHEHDEIIQKLEEEKKIIEYKRKNLTDD